MKRYDQGSSLFWLLFSIIILVESLRLGVGTLNNPGTGFMSLAASGLLGILSLALYLQASLKRKAVEVKPLFSGTLWKRVSIVLIVLFLYARLMPVAGYLISTFLLMAFLFWVLERKKVWWVLTLSLLTTASTYYLFSVLLNCDFPPCIFGP
jgi:putative tricarboxylic transport membrane protein